MDSKTFWKEIAEFLGDASFKNIKDDDTCQITKMSIKVTLPINQLNIKI